MSSPRVTLADVASSVTNTFDFLAGREDADVLFQIALGEQAITAFRATANGMGFEAYAAETKRVRDADKRFAGRRSMPGVYTSGPAVRYFAAVGHILSKPGDPLKMTTEEIITVAKSVYQKGGTDRGDATLAAATTKAGALKALKDLGATIAAEKKAEDAAKVNAAAESAAAAEAEAASEVAETSPVTLLTQALALITSARDLAVETGTPWTADALALEAACHDMLGKGADAALPVAAPAPVLAAV